jgi:rhodanese-related sulfurtransferase
MWPFEKPRHNARELVANGAVLLDVRTAAEFAERHIPGALNIPVQELGTRLRELGPTTRPVVVHCRSGVRSASAAQLLQRAGYDVLDIGGIGNW